MLNEPVTETATALLAPSPDVFTSLMGQSCVTVGDLCRRYMAWHLAGHVQSKTRKQEVSKILRYFPPLYDYQLAGPDRPFVKAAIVAWHTAIGSRYPQTANNCLDTLRSVLHRGQEWGLYHGPDLTLGLKRFPSPHRTRVLTEVEWQQVKLLLLFRPLKARVYFMILLLEGPRGSELREAQWAHFDLTEKVWYKPLTKNGRPEAVEITDATVTLLNLLPRTGPYVFPGETPAQPWSRTACRYHWLEMRRHLAEKDIRMHDLRRTFGTWLMLQTGDLLTVQYALNHASLESTKVYVQHVPKVIRGAKGTLAEKIIGTTDVTAPAGAAVS